MMSGQDGRETLILMRWNVHAGHSLSHFKLRALYKVHNPSRNSGRGFFCLCLKVTNKNTGSTEVSGEELDVNTSRETVPFVAWEGGGDVPSDYSNIVQKSGHFSIIPELYIKRVVIHNQQ